MKHIGVAVAALGLLLVSGCQEESASTSPEESASQPSTGTSPAITTSVAPPSPSGGPNLAKSVADHIELRSAEQASIAGMSAYRLTLSKGYGWAIRGKPAQIVPKLVKDESYDRARSSLFAAEDYVVYFPDSDLPDDFVFHVGPRPGLKVIDTDEFR